MNMVFLALLSVSASEAVWKAGVAKVDVTPQKAMWMAGYASRTKPSEGVENPLYVKALAFEAAGQKMVMVTCDLIGVSRSIAQNVSKGAEEKYHLPRKALLLNASHTHCGPSIHPDRAGIWGLADEQKPLIEDYVRKLESQMIDVIGAALADLKPAKLYLGQSAAGFAGNRRLPVKNGFNNAPHDFGPVDHDVPILKITDESGSKVRAILFGYACHNTTLSYYLFCGDYAGFAQAEIEKANPGAIALFMMGAGGDQNPYPRGTVELCKQHGASLAAAVARAANGPMIPVSNRLQSAFAAATLDFAPLPSPKELQANLNSSNKYLKNKSRYLLDKGDKIDLTYPCPVQVVRLGNEVMFIAIGGELVVDYARRFKREFHGPMVWIAGYSNDVFGYLPSLRVLREGGYEGGGAMLYSSLAGPFADTVEDRVVQTVSRLVKETEK